MRGFKVKRMGNNGDKKNKSSHPEWVALMGMLVFIISLFIESEEAIKASLQITSISISGYFGYVSNKNED